MESHIREKHPKFNPVGLQQYLDSLDLEGTKDAANKILEIHKKLYEYVVTTLKKHFGLERRRMVGERDTPQNSSRMC